VIGPKSKKDAKDPNQSTSDELKASLEDALLEKKVALETKATVAEGFFSLYASLLSKDGPIPLGQDSLQSSQSSPMDRFTRERT
jgi:hypothetical protein